MVSQLINKTVNSILDVLMEPSPQPALTPAHLVFLRRLVTALTATMIAGMIIIITLFVIRFSGEKNDRDTASDITLPDRITLPQGTTAIAFTQGLDWYAVVTSDNRILIFNRATGALQQSVVLE